MFIDASKAHVYVLIDADVNAFVDLPPECRKPGVCGELNYWLYGMRPASKGWESECTKKSGLIGFVLGVASPCCFHRVRDGVSVVVHGDDFVFEGPAISLDSIVSALQSHWIIKVRAVLGPDTGDAKEVSILNRVVRWQGDVIEYEADPRHVEKLLRDMHMEDCKPLSSPGVKVSLDDLEEEGKPLVGEAVTLYRSGAARCNELSVDRPDIPFATTEICRSMSRPMESDMVNLKHANRYLKGHPGLVQRLVGRVILAWELHVYVDSDWAGCRRTRKSTNGGCMVLNGNCLKTWSTTQAVRALSSGEAEYYVAFKGASVALGFRSMAADLGVDVKLIFRSDSSAAWALLADADLAKFDT